MKKFSHSWNNKQLITELMETVFSSQLFLFWSINNRNSFSCVGWLILISYSWFIHLEDWSWCVSLQNIPVRYYLIFSRKCTPDFVLRLIVPFNLYSLISFSVYSFAYLIASVDFVGSTCQTNCIVRNCLHFESKFPFIHLPFLFHFYFHFVFIKSSTFTHLLCCKE